MPLFRSTTANNEVPRLASPSKDSGSNVPTVPIGNLEGSNARGIPDYVELSLEHNLNAIQDRVGAASKPSRFKRLENKIDDLQSNPTGGAINDFRQNNPGTIASAITGIASEIDLKMVEDQIKRFGESSKILMSALDEVAKVHPFIGVAVLAFKAVVTLELKRKSNSKKIVTLDLQMSDMVSILLELDNIKDTDRIAADGATLQGRMQGLMEQVARDIRDCANVCDTYRSKSIVVKVLKSPAWEQRLAGFSTIFADRRKDIELALSMHTTLGVDRVNRNVLRLEEGMKALDEKLTLAMFAMLNSKEEKELIRAVDDRHGREAVIGSDELLKQVVLIGQKMDEAWNVSATSSDGGKTLGPIYMSALLEDLKTDVEKAVEKNIMQFNRNLNAQMRVLEAEVKEVVHREGDRVISAVISGPHDGILDPDLYNIWKDMGWRSSVKARHFIFGLYDYFQVKANLVKAKSTSTSSNDIGLADAGTNEAKQTGDGWSLRYITVGGVQDIVEACDIDCSDFVSVAEANQFTTSRPPDWSLPQWIAYWVAGWRFASWAYKKKIAHLLLKMFACANDVQPINRNVVNYYLESWTIASVDHLLKPIAKPNKPIVPEFQEKIWKYSEAEEVRLEENLKAVGYMINPSTLSLVTGVGRIEKNILPLLYIMLRHHHRILQRASSQILDEFELYDHTLSLHYVLFAVCDRIRELAAAFRYKSPNVAQRFEGYSLGMYKLIYKRMYQDDSPSTDSDGADDDETEDESADPTHLESDQTVAHAFDVSGYISPELAAQEAQIDENVRSLNGTWTGFYFYPDGNSDGVVEFVIHGGDGTGSFSGGGADTIGAFTVSGKLGDAPDEVLSLSFKKIYTELQNGEPLAWDYKGSLNVATSTIKGTWGNDSRPDSAYGGTFCLGRIPAWTYEFRPQEEAFKANRVSALWSLALSAVRHQVKRQLWTWSYFKKRRDQRIRYVKLYTRFQLSRNWVIPHNLSEDETREMRKLEQGFSTADARYYRSVAESEKRKVIVHYGVGCDACSSAILGVRTLCLTCGRSEDDDSFDLCSHCTDMPVSKKPFAHLFTHPVVKSPNLVRRRHKEKLIQRARDYVEWAQQFLGTANADQTHKGMVDLKALAEPAAPTIDVDTIPQTETLIRICDGCRKPLGRVCFCCTDCNDLFGKDCVIFCKDCEVKDEGCKHHAEALYIRFHLGLEEDEVAPNDIGSRMSQHSALSREDSVSLFDCVADLDKRFREHETKVDRRLSKIEELLEKLMVKLD